MTDYEAFLKGLKDQGLIVDYRMTGPDSAAVQVVRPVERIQLDLKLDEDRPVVDLHGENQKG